MKTIQLTVLFIFIPIVFFAQTLTGLWVGNVTNDSNTVRKDQSFEIVLTQYKNKVYGYSRSTFIVNDSLFYILKRVKGTIDGDACEVKDDEVVSYNFHGRLDKGVKMTTSFHFDQSDSVWRMDGDWKTNKTKKYYSLSGKATLSQEKDLTKSKIIPHLEELKLADDVPFYKESKKAEEALAVYQPDKPANSDKAKSNPDIAKTQSAVNSNQQKSAVMADAKSNQTTKQASTVSEKPVASAIENNKPKDEITQTKTQPVATVSQTSIGNQQIPGNESGTVTGSSNNSRSNNSPIQSNSNTVASSNSPTTTSQKPVVTVEQKTTEREFAKNTSSVTPTNAVESKKEITPQSSGSQTTAKDMVATIRENKPIVVPAAALVTQRKTTAPQVVNFTSDSLMLSLYDNGEVDGDTVSVLLDGEIIIAKQELKVSAIKKTIYVPAGKGDSLTLVLYAENLGKYPPNTGLLIVHDGDQSYQIRFSADLQQNAAVIFKRKRN